MDDAAPSLRQKIAELAADLAAAGVEDARRDAWLLLAAATGRSRADLVAGSEDALSGEDGGRLAGFVGRRLAREPIAYIVGEREFWSLPFRVSPAVLVPRPESEIVVEAALDRVRRDAVLRILDLGTGSGCLLLALLSELPSARGLGVDRGAAALEVARHNAAGLGMAGRARFREGDWGQGLEGLFDLIVSNPPYVARGDAASLEPEVVTYEPAEALFAGGDGLEAYRALLPDCARLLAADGVVCLEIGQGQAPAVTSLARQQGFRLVASRADLAGIVRCLVLQWSA